MAGRKKQELNSAQEIPIAPTKTPLIFISHDSRDAEIAELFSKLLSSVSAGLLKSFRSSDKRGTQGIEYGVEWFPEIMKKLDESSDIVCLLTQHSVDRPWILYEAGVAKGKLSTTVLGIALGIPLNIASNGPFAQFQNCGDDQESLTKLVLQLVKRLPNADPDKEVIEDQVRTFKEKLAEHLKKIEPYKKIDSEKEETSVAKLFEEVKIMFKDLPSKIEHRVDSERRRSYRFHPEFLHELIHAHDDDNFLGFLIIISILKNDYPWLYEIGLEVYKNLKNPKSLADLHKTIEEFEMAIHLTVKNPLMNGITNRNKEYYFVFDRLRFTLREYLDIALSKQKFKKFRIKENESEHRNPKQREDSGSGS